MLRSEWLIDKAEARAPHAMMTAMQPQAAEVGAEVLLRGGNAVDAAVATALAMGVVEPFMSGIGGMAWMTYREAASGKAVAFDGSAVLPQAIRPDMFTLLEPATSSGLYGWRATRDDAANTGWLAPAVPGLPALLEEAHGRYGRAPWRDLVQPAIQLAEEGFEVNHYVAMLLSASFERLGRCPEARRTFFKAGGAPYAPALGEAPGDRLVQPDLARTLRLIADQGADVVYRGEVGRLIVEDMARHGGLITEADLAVHRTRVVEAATTGYRGFEVLGLLQNSGYATVAEALQIVEDFDLRRLGFQAPAAVHLQIEALRRAFVDRLHFLGDAEQAPVPYDGLTSPRYAADQRATIDPARATPNIGPGDPWAYDSGRSAAPLRAGSGGEGQTTHINVIDRDRNMVSLTCTLGSIFGSGVVVRGTGITLNNATMWFDPVPGSIASIGPGKRLLGAASNVLVLREGQPFLALGSPGGRRIMSAVFQCLLNVLDFELGMQAAISAPRVHTEGPSTLISRRFPRDTLEELGRIGHDLVVTQDSLSNHAFARPSGIVVDPASGELRAGVFQYSPATAVGI